VTVGFANIVFSGSSKEAKCRRITRKTGAGVRNFGVEKEGRSGTKARLAIAAQSLLRKEGLG